MIKLERPALPARHALLKKGKKATREMVNAWRADPEAFEPDIKADIYKAAKDELVVMQHGKCCYCEAAMQATSYGAVEHYRPKKGVTEEPAHKGYWWLAYDWENLLLSCTVCNTSHKQNHFPLGEGSRRMMTPDDRLEDEQPLILNPCEMEPREHLTFRAEVCVGKTPVGVASEELLGLNRDKSYADEETGEHLETGLLSRRRRHYQLLEQLYDTLRFLTEQIEAGRLERDEFWHKKWDELQAHLRDPCEEFSAMAQVAFLQSFELVLD